MSPRSNGIKMMLIDRIDNIKDYILSL